MSEFQIIFIQFGVTVLVVDLLMVFVALVKFIVKEW